MELGYFMDVMRKRWRLATVLMLVTVIVSVFATVTTTPKYRSDTMLYFSLPGGKSIYDLTQGVSYTGGQLASYSQVATSPLVLDAVRTSLKLDITPAELASMVTVTVPKDTVTMVITVQDTDPQQAAAIANSMSTELANAIKKLSQNQTDGVTVAVLKTAVAPQQPFSPNIPRNIALGVALGLMIGVGAALLRELMDTKLRDRSDLQNLTKIPVIGSLSRSTEMPGLFISDKPFGRQAEELRGLRANLQFVGLAHDIKTLMVTSSVPGEGKSTIAANLAVAMADAGKRIALVEGDLRRPTMADRLGLEGSIGLTNVMIGQVGLRDAMQRLRKNVDVLTSGAVPPNPSEMLASPELKVVIDQLGMNYDFVIIDASPLLAVSDPLVISEVVGGAIMVVGAGIVRKSELRAALEHLARVNGQVAGIVMNRVKVVGRKQGSYYGYGYSDDENSRRTPVSSTGPRRSAGLEQSEPAVSRAVAK